MYIGCILAAQPYYGRVARPAAGLGSAAVFGTEVVAAVVSSAIDDIWPIPRGFATSSGVFSVSCVAFADVEGIGYFCFHGCSSGSVGALSQLLP